MSPINEHLLGQAYWRSLTQRAQSPEALASLEQEFPGYDPVAIARLSRRRFMQLMAAALSMAGLTLSGCRRWPESEIRPHVRQPEGADPGMPQHYATSFELGGVATGVLAKSYDGRPIKIEGNPLHPFSLGAAGAWAQASVLDLYDPQRSRQCLERVGGPDGEAIPRSWNDFAAFARGHFEALGRRGGRGLAVLTRPTSSPTQARLKAEFLKAFPQALWAQYEPIHRDQEIAGAKLAFGQALRPQHHLEKARVIAGFDADLLGLHPAHQRHARDWAAGRRTCDAGRMSRMFLAEPSFSVSGSVADHRLAVSPTRLLHVLAALACELGLGEEPSPALDAHEKQWVTRLAADLQGHRGASLVAAGPALPAPAHALVHAINAALGNVGATITYTPEPLGQEPGCVESFIRLAAAMRGGQIDTLLILDGNPVYDGPADLVFEPGGSPARPITSIHLSAYADETSARCRWHLPLAHYLECWGDGRAWDGTYGVQQPMILPLFGGRSALEVVATILGLPEIDGRSLVQQTARGILTSPFEPAWERVLREGVLVGSAWPAISPGAPKPAPRLDRPPACQGLELVFTPDISVYDGRFACNGWLQELPDPLTSLTWDNAALLSKTDADALGLTTGDVVRVQVENLGPRSLEIPAYVMPGLARGVVALPLGYGRTRGGHVGLGVGVDAFRLRTARGGTTVAAVTATGRRASLAMTQDHHLIDAVGMWGREVRVGEKGKSGHLIREASLEEYRRDPHVFAEEGAGEAHQVFDPPHLFNRPHAWGMAIDLNKCIGCSACVIACQAENNIPIVGKDQVANHRQMHWLRIDRYFKGPVEDPDVVYAPVACSHCENAPCEQVCPVAATVHDTEGLNTMVYNRCIGTRYCSNNCPTKTRRFNYFDFHSTDPRGRATPWLGMPDQQQRESIDPVKQMVFNPEVTVRMRGVMEKCTYCVQRIEAAKIQATAQHARGERDAAQLRDGEVVVACQGTCPTGAIIFGDLNDPDSQVSRARQSPRAYVMLEELNLRHRTGYLAKVRNPNES